MDARWMMLGLMVAFAGCDSDKSSAEVPAPAAEGAKAPAPITREAVKKEMAAAGDGPGCDTLVKEVRQACVDHYASGLDVNCNTFITQVNTAIQQKNGDLFKDPSGKNKDMPEQAGAKMCAMVGKRLREQVASAGSTPPGPHCVELGKKLDAACFAKIGQTPFPSGCSGLIVTTSKWNSDSDKLCEMHIAMAAGTLK